MHIATASRSTAIFFVRERSTRARYTEQRTVVFLSLRRIMVTSALVVTLESDAAARSAAIEALASDARLTLGEAAGVRLPVVAETPGLAAAEALAEELARVAGVFAVDVVLVDFDPDADVDAAPRLGRRRREEDGDGPA
jgi:hypothetical protein